MIYLKSFNLPSEEAQYNTILYEPRTCFNNYYPFRLFPEKNIEKLNFKEITIFYGGNGSGKSTLLNIIAEKLNAERKQPFNKGEFFNKFVGMCDYEEAREKPSEIKIVTSDDVFDYLFDVRSINNKLDNKRNELFEEYLHYKFSDKKYNMNEYEDLKKTVETRSKTMSSYVRSKLTNNTIVEQSNGESALMYFEKELEENAIYILDEPENSLSAVSQMKLVKFIEDTARFYNCQFIISTHSPFILSLRDAFIINLDDGKNDNVKWTELENVKVYYDFFKEHENDFIKK